MTPLNIKSFGATGKDDTAAINYACAVGKAQGQPVLIPAGTWQYSDLLNLDGIELYGEVDATGVLLSTLWALNPMRAAIMLTGSSGVRELKLSGVKPTARGTTRESCRIVAVGCSGFAVNLIEVSTCAGAGIRVDNSSHGMIENCRLTGTLADSIHITDRSSYVTIQGNAIDSSGDDGIAVVSYQNQGAMCSNISATGNRITNNVGGRCMSVVGGSDILYQQNYMSGNANAAGLYLAQENSYQTFGVHKVVASRNTIRNCGNAKTGHYAVMLFSDGKEANTDVTLERNVIWQDDARGGIRAFGPLTNVLLDQNVVVATPPTQVVAGVVVKQYTDGAVGVS